MIIIDIFARGSCGLVTIGYTSGSGGVWMTAFCAMAVGGWAFARTVASTIDASPPAMRSWRQLVAMKCAAGEFGYWMRTNDFNGSSAMR
jgi:hypothetical protein